jgi:hypothetical protein
MKKYDLRQIFEQIINISQNIETFAVEELWEWTKFDGTNEYLNETLNIHEYSGVPIGCRDSLLNNQLIEGDYLLFDYIGHLPEFAIRQFKDFEIMIKKIIGGGGILNSFTTLQIPIINGQCRDISFALKYKNEKTFENKLEKITIERIKHEIIKICE